MTAIRTFKFFSGYGEIRLSGKEIIFHGVFYIKFSQLPITNCAMKTPRSHKTAPLGGTTQL
jgi:hypothetical protein